MSMVSTATCSVQNDLLARCFSSRVQLWLEKTCLYKNSPSQSALLHKCLPASPAMSALQSQPFLSVINGNRSAASSGFAFSPPGWVASAATAATEQMISVKDADPVVSPQWLNSHLGNPNLKVLDASWYMPGDNRNPLEEYKTSRIPGALFFDVDGIVDPTSKLPHMLPNEAAFATAVSALGIHNTDTIVVYDGKGIFSSARVWWMFRTFGHGNVVVLDGGLPNWRSAGFSVEGSPSQDLLESIRKASEAAKLVYEGKMTGPPSFKASLHPELLVKIEQITVAIVDRKQLIVDARSKERYDGTVPEPRKGLRSGHIPFSKNVPFNEVLKDGATLLDIEALRKKFNDAGVSLDAPIVASCGTGVTACVLALALHRLGKHDVAIYDGSWTEWGGLSMTPIATTFAR